MSEDTITMPISYAERLVEIADCAGVKQGRDIVGPHDTVVVETVRNLIMKARGEVA